MDNNRKNSVTDKTESLDNMIFKFKLINLSSLSSNAKKNKNKFVLEEQYLRNDEDFSMKLLFKRMKKVVAHIKDLSNSYKDIFRWAYPIHSLIVMIFLILYFLFSDFNYLGAHLIFFIILILIFQSNFYKRRFKANYDYYISSMTNKYDFNQKDILYLDDLEDQECLNDLYLISEDKDKSSIMSKLVNPFKYYKEYKEKYNKILFKFSKFIAFLEKIKNLFLWKDQYLSLIFISILILAFLFVNSIKLKYLLLISIVKKFISGFSYYKNKYENNCEISNIMIHYIYEEWISLKSNSKYLKKNLKKINFYNQDIEIEKQGEKDKEKNDKNKFDSDDILNPIYLNISSLNFKQMTDDIEKIRNFIKEFIEHHLDAVININFLNSIQSISEIKSALEKSQSLLKLQKRSYIYKDNLDNKSLLKNDLDIEDHIYNYILNIKSDLYYAKYYAKYNNE